MHLVDKSTVDGDVVRHAQVYLTNKCVCFDNTQCFVCPSFYTLCKLLGGVEVFGDD